MFMLSAGGLAVPSGFAGGERKRRWWRLALHRGVPDQPADPQAVQRPAEHPEGAGAGRSRRRGTRSARTVPDPAKQDCLGGATTSTRTGTATTSAATSCGRARASSANWAGWKSTDAARLPDQARRSPATTFTSSPVQPINSFGKNVTPPRQQQREPAQPAREHDLRLQRDVPGPAHQRRVRPRRARALREPPGRGQRLRPPGLRRAELLVPDAPPQRPHRARSPTASRTTPRTASARSAASRTRRRGSRASTSTSCTSATRPAATTARSSRSSGSTTTSTATPAPTSTRAWSA